MDDDVAEDEILAEIANIAQDVIKSSNVEIATPVENENEDFSNIDEKQDIDKETGDGEEIEDPGTPLGDEYQPPPDSDDDEDDIQITIGDVRSNVTTFRPQAANAAGAKPGTVSGAIGKQGQKLDLDAVADVNGTPLFDLQLQAFTGTDEAPWRKPGADITDYFNYGFTEYTWVLYCERQQKLRAEYGNQATANKILFSSLTGTAPAGVANAEMPKSMAMMSKQTLNTNFQNDYHAQAIMQKVEAGTLPIVMRTRLTIQPPADLQQRPQNIPVQGQQPQQQQLQQPVPSSIRIPDVPLSTIPIAKSVPSLGSSQQMSQSALQNLQSAAHLQLSSSPPVSPGMTPPPDDSEFDRPDQQPVLEKPPSQESSNIAVLHHPPPTMTPEMQQQAGQGVVSGGGSVLPAQGVVVSSAALHSGAAGNADSMSMPPPHHFINMSVPPPRLPNTNLPPPGFPGMPGVPGMPPINYLDVPPPMFPPGAMQGPPGMSVRFPPPYGFMPQHGGHPGGPRLMQSTYVREPFNNFIRPTLDEARSPASYSDKSSDEERRDHRRLHGGGGPPGIVPGSGGGGFGGAAPPGTAAYSRRPTSTMRSDGRGGSGSGSHHHSSSSSRDKSSRSGRHRSRSPRERERDHHDDRSRSRSSRKHRRGDDDKDDKEKEKGKDKEKDSSSSSRKHKIKQEPVDPDDVEKSSSKKSSSKSEHRERSSRKKKKKDRHDSDDDVSS